MGFSEKPTQTAEEGVLESDNSNSRKWVIAGIALRASLKPIYTTIPTTVHHHKKAPQEQDEEDSCSTATTPTGEEAKVPTTLTCPPAPRKQKPSLQYCNYGGASNRDVFNPPDLETVFVRRHVERAS